MSKWGFIGVVLGTVFGMALAVVGILFYDWRFWMLFALFIAYGLVRYADGTDA